ncbi:glycoside hydrolase family 19 protein [Ekhidna sp.]|uniref:glycoside hydrolase family 19 protein n=1 Tax=Ekhidna sp. TaxID=2608089 RepID=UPI003BA91570
MKQKFLCLIILLAFFISCQSDNHEFIKPEQSEFISILDNPELQQIKSSLQNDDLVFQNGRTPMNTSDLIEAANWNKVRKLYDQRNEYDAFGMVLDIETDDYLNNLVIFSQNNKLYPYLFTFNPSEKWKNDLVFQSENPLDGETKLISLFTGKTYHSNKSRTSSTGRTTSECCNTVLVKKNNNEIRQLADGSLDIIVRPPTYIRITLCGECSGYGDGPNEEWVDGILDEGGGGSPGEEDDESDELKLPVVDEEDCNTSKTDILDAFPNAKDTDAKEVADYVNKHAADFGIDNKYELQHFLAQTAHESKRYDGKPFGAFEENLNYRIAKLGVDYWIRRFNPASNPTADANKQNPNDYKRTDKPIYVIKDKFANFVYGGRMGNNKTGDGYKYRGRGLMQLTGKDNYTAFASFYKENYDSSVDCLANPDLLTSNKEIGVISALWFFKENILNKTTIKSNTSVDILSKIINGGDNGLEERRDNLKKAKEHINCI